MITSTTEENFTLNENEVCVSSLQELDNLTGKKKSTKEVLLKKKKSFFLQKWCFTDVGMRTAWRLYDSHANTMNRSVCHRFSTNRTSSFVVCVYNDTVSYAVQIHVCVLTNVQYLSTIVTSPMKTHFTI